MRSIEADSHKSVRRREFLAGAGAAGLCLVAPWTASAAVQGNTAKPDYTIRIGSSSSELVPDQIITTTTYNGTFPGPLVRLKEGQQVVVDIYNDTDTPEQLHWHGQFVPVDVDGASEEGTPFIPAHGMRRIAFTPKPAGFRFYHTHVVPSADFSKGTYTGQAGPVYIEPRNEPGNYDREVFLVLKEFAPIRAKSRWWRSCAAIAAVTTPCDQPNRRERYQLSQPPLSYSIMTF